MSILSPSQHSSVHIDSDGWKYRQSGLSSPLHQNTSRPEMAVINGSQNNKVYSLPALNAPKCGRLNVAQPYQSRYSSTLANQLHQTDSPYSDDSYDVMGSAGFDPSSSIRLAQLEYSLAPLHKAPSKLSKIIKYPQLINPALRHVQQQHQQGITINSSHPVIDSANSDDTELGTAPSKPSNLHFQKTGQYLGAIESPKDSVDASIPSMPLPSDNVSNSTLNTPLQWPATAIKRHTKSLKMSPTGIFSAKQRVPYDVLANARYVMDEEFQTMRYTAATCDPDHFIARGYDTRASRILRKITFTFQFVYNVMTQIFSWFLLGNFTILFYYLINELSLTISSPSTNLRGVIIKTVPAVIDVIKYAYPAVLVCLVIISFGSRPRVYQIFYTTLMFVFGIIGIGMMGILAHRIYLLTKQQFAATSPDTEFRNLFANLTRMAGYETNDSAQLLMNSILIQTNRVYQEHLQANIASNRTDLMFFGMVFGSTLGGFILSGMLHMDVAHLITCFVQYLMLQPSYINILTVYAFANLRGATWETKGDTQAVKLPSINTKRQSDGTAVAEITVTLDRRDISEHYKQALHCMTASAVSTDVTKYEMETEARQEDKYKGFRTALVLSYIASNAVLFAVAANIGINLYILVLIGVVSFLNGTKMVGVVLFVGLRLFTKIFSRLGIWGRWHRGSQVSTSFAYETWKARPAKKNMLCDNGEVDLSRHSLDHSETTLGSPILYN
ncbi:hypothetical protein BSLG_006358 [Batrachochytrium salamandrivorans]|nr:hypothetical protein BSLG_006358 [Batrachochytrium salamandrivorans]